MLRVYWAGWYKEGTSDKLWGVLERHDEDGNIMTYYNFWCRRGAKMQFKHVGQNKKYTHKSSSGYKSIDVDTLEQIYPGFMDEANTQLIFGIFAGTVR